MQDDATPLTDAERLRATVSAVVARFEDCDVRESDHTDGLEVYSGPIDVAHLTASGEIEPGYDAPEYEDVLRALADALGVDRIDCPRCDGRGGGEVRKPRGRIGIGHRDERCEACEGTGEIAG